MKIEFRPDTEEWLRTQVDAGRFASLADAIDALVANQRVSDAELETQGLDWAKPFLKVAEADIAEGRVADCDDVFDRLQTKFPPASE